MAKVSSARPASRGSQNGAPAARTTRSTRSQSHDAPESATTSRQSPRKASQNTTKTTPKKRGRPARGGIDLDTVDEDDGVEEQLEAELQGNNEAPVEELDEFARRTSRHSVMSGTTAKTSFSQEEINELDAEVIVDVLPSLATAAEDLAKLLVVAEPKARMVIRKEIRADGSRHNKLYKTRLASLNVNKHSFGSTEYIQPNIILRALLGVQDVNDIPPGPWRPDGVIYKVNLASMVRTALVTIPDNIALDDEAYSALARLDVAFPSAIAGPGFRVNAFDLCLDLLTQLSIIRLHMYRADPSLKPVEVITDTFFEPDEDGELSFRHRDGLHLIELPAEDQIAHSDAVRSRVDLLISAFETNTTDAGLRTIRARHKWESFVEKVVQYYLARKSELDEQIEAVGGVDQIMLDLSQEVERRTVTREAELKRRSLTQAGGTPKKGFGKAGIQRMMEMEARLSAASTAPAAVTAPIAQMVEPASEQQAAGPDDWQRVEDDDYPEPTTHAQSTARSSLAAMQGVLETQRQNAAKGKMRSFIDRQPGAVRVSFDDSQDDEYPAPAATGASRAPYYQSPLRSSAKRPLQAYVEDDFEPTQDPGFEVDTRDTTAADHRRRAAPQQRSSQPRFSTAETSSTPAASAPQPSATPSPPKRQRKNPGSSIPPPMPSIDPEEDRSTSRGESWEQAKINARHATAMAHQRRPAQVRTPWSNEEERALIDLIEEEGVNGISYSALKSLDNNLGEHARLARRSAEDMRFKARNMKETFLKARVEVPRNFDYVMLDRKAIVKLHNLGILYRQEQVRSGPVHVDAQ